MEEAGSLTPVEARGLRRRRTRSQWAQGSFLAVACTAMFALASAGEHAWLLVAVPGAVGCLWLHVRGMRCPRCRGSVFGPRPANDRTSFAGDPAVFAPPLPTRCRTCGVGLIPAHSGGRGG